MSKSRRPSISKPIRTKVRDVSGAGDTMAAVMAVAAMRTPHEYAMRAANARSCRGSRQARHLDGFAWRIASSHSARGLARAGRQDRVRLVGTRRAPAGVAAERLRIGFTNGCFDLLHRGHVKLLAEARAACDRLVVGLNSDSSTARLRGEGRPINPAKGRAEVLAALEAVDLVAVFEEDTPLELSSADLELLHASLSEAFGCSLAILPSHSISQGPRERTRAFPSMKAANFQRSAPRRLQSRCASALQVVVLRFP